MLQIKVLPKDGAEGNGEVRRVKDPGTYRIGRDPENDLVLDDPSISRFHSTVTCGEEGKWIMKDNSSRNGIVVNGERMAELQISPSQTLQVYLGEIVLELSVPRQADVTRSIDVSLIRARSRGGRADTQAVLRFVPRWFLGGYAFLIVSAWLQTKVKSDTQTLGRVAATAFGVFLTVIILTLIFSGISKLNHRDYRFQKIFRITYLFMAVSFFLDPLASLMIDQATSAGSQGLLSAAYNFFFLGTGAFLVLREIFPHLRAHFAAGLILLLFLFGFGAKPVANTISRTYQAAPEAPPSLNYPLPGASWNRDLDSVFAEMDKLKPGIDEERKEILKLR